MDHSSFVIAAFALTGVTMGWLTVSSMLAMKRSEALAKDVSRRG